MRRIFAYAAVAASLLLLVTPAAEATPASAATASSGPYLNSLDYGAPATPQSIVPSNLDVQIHKRSIGDGMDVMDAGHGADCSAPPATHSINTLAQAVYACKDHLMTAITAGDYGEIALTPPTLVDFSAGQATVQVNVSTLQFCSLDWIELWVSPYSENIALPHSGTVDLQGPPKDGLRFTLSENGDAGAHPGMVYRFDNFAESILPRQLTTGLDTLVPPSPTVRTTFEIDLSTSHVRFGLPAVGAGGTWWTDTNLSPLVFTQGVVQLVHHSYNPSKHCPGAPVNTWHWSGLSINPAVPFTILNAGERSINPAGATSAHFLAPAPSNSILRFSGIGTITVSYDSGATWQAAQIQSQRDHATDHFSTYWTPAPARVTQVLFRGVNWYGGSWWVRDPAIWSLSTTPVQAPPSRSASSGGGGNAPHNPPAASAPKPVTNNPPASKTSSGSGGSSSIVSDAKAQTPFTQLVAGFNPNQDPVVTLLILSVLAGALAAVFRVIRG